MVQLPMSDEAMESGEMSEEAMSLEHVATRSIVNNNEQ